MMVRHGKCPIMEKNQRDGIREECCRLGREQEWEGVIRSWFRPETLLSLDGELLAKEEEQARDEKVQTGPIWASHLLPCLLPLVTWRDRLTHPASL